MRARLNGGEPISTPNPLGNALALLLGAGAAALTAWQQALVAAVFELCLVGVMVIYELLGHGRVIADAEVTSPGVEPLAGSVTSFVRDRIFPADGERLEMKSLTSEYRTWCGQTGCAPIGLSELLDEIEKVCSKLGIEIEVGATRKRSRKR